MFEIRIGGGAVELVSCDVCGNGVGYEMRSFQSGNCQEWGLLYGLLVVFSALVRPSAFTPERLIILLIGLHGLVCCLASELQALKNCRLVPTEWADGDSFQIESEAGQQMTIRLYGVDCFEIKVAGATDARRLRAQRRYFGITDYGSTEDSIALAKNLGREAKQVAFKFLAEPFTVYTAFADARGDGRYKRYYGFVVNQVGEDLAAHLVKNGLARAYGVVRSTYDGQSHQDYRDFLADLELQAAKLGQGAWAKTNWQTLPSERQQQRDEDREIQLAVGTQLPAKASINPNESSRDELMSLPGIGETIAIRIIEMRPFETIVELQKVPGIGQKKFNDIKPYLTLKTD